jgi:hypothetical protein
MIHFWGTKLCLFEERQRNKFSHRVDRETRAKKRET